MTRSSKGTCATVTPSDIPKQSYLRHRHLQRKNCSSRSGPKGARLPAVPVGRVFRDLALGLSCCLLAGTLRGAPLVPINALGVSLPPGFRISVYAGPGLANDIQALSSDSRGDVVVAGPNYIRTLLDINNDGRADRAVNFVDEGTGADGLCFDGANLYFVNGQGLFVCVDADFDGVADGPPSPLFPLQPGENGGHSVRLGPDGWLYVAGGNGSGWSPENATLPGTPIHNPEAGALVRLPLSGGGTEVLADGFRNPYDFAFNAWGDLMLLDQDAERDLSLPWYVSPRLFFLVEGGHYGWRLPDRVRGWPRPDYSPENVSAVASLGRGAPAGVVCYRHYQFPQYYRNGLFLADWSVGRIYFVSLEPDGANYRAQPELFLESLGRNGFTPSDLAVARDGSLLVATGGRKTPGSVYRIQYVADPAYVINATNWLQTSASDLIAVMVSPQPEEAWSRAYWVPVAQALGPEIFDRLAADPTAAPELRLRAVEILTEVFGGLSTAAAAAVAQAPLPSVRGRVAWSLGRSLCDGCGPVLLRMTGDASPYVRRQALGALGDLAVNADVATLQQAVGINLAFPDKSIRFSAARLATYLTEPAWDALWSRLRTSLPQARLTADLALIWRHPDRAVHPEALQDARSVLATARNPDLMLEAIELLQLGLGGYHLQNPSSEVFTGYEPAHSLKPYADVVKTIRQTVEPLLPSGNSLVNFEAARLLAMVEDDQPTLPKRVLAQIDDRTTPASDFHYLAVLSRLTAPSLTNLTAEVAGALLSLHSKLGDGAGRPLLHWPLRFKELVQALIKKNPGLPSALLNHDKFASPGHEILVPLLGPERRQAAARKFLVAVNRFPSFPWSEDLIDLLSALPAPEIQPLFRRHWSDPALRDRLILKLTENPIPEDRDKFVWALGSDDETAARGAAAALLALPRDPSQTTPVAALRRLRHLLREPAEQAGRVQVLDLIHHETGQKMQVREQGLGGDSLARAYQPVFDWFAKGHPDWVRQLDANDQATASAWGLRLKLVRWPEGNAARGAQVYAERGCQYCHTGTSHLGPDLGGLSLRRTRDEMFEAMIFPNRDVAPAYRVTVIETRDGLTFSGAVAHEAPDLVILQPTPASAVRLFRQEIKRTYKGRLSYMPSGLLDGLDPSNLADLYAFLQTLPSFQP
jgi:putative heme-binding domain-containing protein